MLAIVNLMIFLFGPFVLSFLYQCCSPIEFWIGMFLYMINFLCLCYQPGAVGSGMGDI